MTLSTHIYVHDPIDAREVFGYMALLLEAPLDYKFTENERSISAAPMQGLAAWLIVTRNSDGTPLQDDAFGHNDWCQEDAVDEGKSGCDRVHSPAHHVDVDIDTGYSYKDEHGGCGDLHARLVTLLGRWLDERGVGWSWKNEFTGEVFERYDGLDDLGTGGREAQAWFTDTVKPAIVAKVASEGGNPENIQW